MTVPHQNADELVGDSYHDGDHRLLGRMFYNKFQGYYARAGGAVFDGDNVAGLTATLNGTGTTADTSLAPFVRATTSTTINTDAGIVATGVGLRSSWACEARCLMKVGATITTSRYWVGMQSATPMGSADPAISGAMFRYDTAVDTGGYWACWTNDGTSTGTATQLTSGIQGGVGLLAVSGMYDLRIKIEAIQGNAPNKVMFFIKDLLVATHTTNMPAAATTLQPCFAVRCLAGSAQRDIDVAQFIFNSQPIY